MKLSMELLEESDQTPRSIFSSLDHTPVLCLEPDAVRLPAPVQVYYFSRAIIQFRFSGIPP
ncbi:Uncharacterized protein DAT39_005682 [Clarias magur]|uniref:Uncharacterized protein n=1 Tax=Clarias magur TaxID=1594786 RepID=A0A8J4X7C4_CLAMG|nr:Uncharacterized protein DAT39_005682 [Clarias magur]